jgi:hypothetical protein
MTIDEAIAQLKDLRKDREGFLENDEPDSEFAIDIEAIDVAVKALEETAELKRLLLLALDDFAVNYINYCDCLECSDCPYHVDIEQFEGCSTRWKHLDEAVQILGDDADCWR